MILLLAASVVSAAPAAACVSEGASGTTVCHTIRPDDPTTHGASVDGPAAGASHSAHSYSMWGSTLSGTSTSVVLKDAPVVGWTEVRVGTLCADVDNDGLCDWSDAYVDLWNPAASASLFAGGHANGAHVGAAWYYDPPVKPAGHSGLPGAHAPQWILQVPGEGEDEARAVALSPDGTTAYAAGYHQAPEGCWHRAAYVVATDAATGELQWAHEKASGTEGPYEYWTLTATADRVFLGGLAHDGSSNVFRTHALVTALDAATGAEVWSRTLDVDAGDMVLDIVHDAGADVVLVAGKAASWDHAGSVDMLVAAFDGKTGDPLWLRVGDGGHGGYNEARSVALDGATGRAFIGGTIDNGERYNDFLVTAVDVRTGRTLWAQAYDGPAGVDDYVATLTVDGGRVVVGGTAEGPLDPWGDATIVAYDAATGDLLWERHYMGTGLRYDGVNDLTIVDGSVYAVGTTHRGPHYLIAPFSYYVYVRAEAFAVSLDAATGIPRWMQFSPGHPVPEPGEGLHVDVTDGTLYMAGRYKAEATGIQVVALDALDGTARWTAGYATAANSYSSPAGLVVSGSAERVIVAGMVGAPQGSLERDPTPVESTGDFAVLSFATH